MMTPLPQAPRNIDPIHLAKLIVVDGVLCCPSKDGAGDYVWEPHRQRWRWRPNAEVR